MRNYRQKFDDSLTQLLNECGAFFAFGNKQFDEQKKEGVKYYNMGAGLICPQDNAKKFNASYGKLVEQMVKDDIEENGLEAIIKRELYNHECFYTGDIEDCVEALSEYPVTEEQVAEVYRKELPNSGEW